MECIINGTKVKNVGGDIYKFGKKKWSSNEETWFILKGYTRLDGYIAIQMNYKLYLKHRLLYKIANPNWDIDDLRPNNSIDHINIDCRNNSLENLRPATRLQQNLNRKCMINVKGYTWIEKLKKWVARISINNKNKYLGQFELESDARQAYLDAVAKHRTTSTLNISSAY